MKAGIRAEYQQPPGLVSPPDDVLAHDCLHDGVEATLWGVQITRNLGPLHLMGKTYKYFLYSNVYIIKN